MRTHIARVLACTLAASVVLGSVVLAEPALASTGSAVCTESHAAKAARATVRHTLHDESAALHHVHVGATAQLAIADSRQHAVLTDPAATEADRGRAAAAVALPTTLLALVVDAEAEVAHDRPRIEHCGLAAMRHLALRAHDREVRFALDALIASRTAAHAAVRWDTLTRDSYIGADEQQRAVWDQHLIADDFVLETLDHAIRKLRKQLD